MKKELITFDEICELEPAISFLHLLSTMIGRKRGVKFCRTAIWYTFFKPVVVHLIGFERVARKKDDTTSFVHINGVDYDSEEGGSKFPELRQFCSSVSTDKRLYTPEAYDVAYQTILDALPDCNHDGWC